MYYIHTLDQADWKGNDQFLAGPLMQQMVKALEAGTGVDAAGFEGGRALMYESLDNVLQSVTLSEEDCTLWRSLPKKTIRATVDQYNRRTSLGSRWGMAVGESESPTDQLSEIARAFAEVKFYRSRREISDIALLVSMTEDPETLEETAGATLILHALNEDMYSGEPAALPSRVKGILSWVNDSQANGGDVNLLSYDMAGKVLDSRKPFEQMAARVRNRGGRITHNFCNPLIQADFSEVYSTAERIMITQGNNPDTRIFVGATIGGIMTAQGALYWEGDPFCKVGWAAPVAAADGPDAPAAPTAVSGAAAGSGGNIPAGGYFYRVSAVNEKGESITTASAEVTVAAGEKVTLTISHADAQATGFRIYRSAKDAADASDCRYLYCCKRTGASTTFVDSGFWVPGTTSIVMLDLRPTATVIQWSQLLPLTKKRLAETGPTRPFLMNLSGALRLAKPEWIGVIRNVVPRYVYQEEGWNPLGAI